MQKFSGAKGTPSILIELSTQLFGESSNNLIILDPAVRIERPNTTHMDIDLAFVFAGPLLT